MNLVVTTIYMSNMMHLLLLGGDSILERLENKRLYSCKSVKSKVSPTPSKVLQWNETNNTSIHCTYPRELKFFW